MPASFLRRIMARADRGSQREIGREAHIQTKRDIHTGHTGRHWQAGCLALRCQFWPHLKVKSYILENCSNRTDAGGPSPRSSLPFPARSTMIYEISSSGGWMAARQATLLYIQTVGFYINDKLNCSLTWIILCVVGFGVAAHTSFALSLYCLSLSLFRYSLTMLFLFLFFAFRLHDELMNSVWNRCGRCQRQIRKQKKHD